MDGLASIKDRRIKLSTRSIRRRTAIHMQRGPRAHKNTRACVHKRTTYKARDVAVHTPEGPLGSLAQGAEEALIKAVTVSRQQRGFVSVVTRPGRGSDWRPGSNK